MEGHFSWEEMSYRKYVLEENMSYWRTCLTGICLTGDHVYGWTCPSRRYVLLKAISTEEHALLEDISYWSTSYWRTYLRGRHALQGDMSYGRTCFRVDMFYRRTCLKRGDSHVLRGEIVMSLPLFLSLGHLLGAPIL